MKKEMAPEMAPLFFINCTERSLFTGNDLLFESGVISLVPLALN